jgi:hypothetical protein
LVAVVAFGSLLAACGGAPVYTIRQAVIDMPAFEPATRFYDSSFANCVAEYLFERLPPGQVKSIVQGSDLGYSPPIVTVAEGSCGGIG